MARMLDPSINEKVGRLVMLLEEVALDGFLSSKVCLPEAPP